MVDISYLGFDRANLHRLRRGDQLRERLAPAVRRHERARARGRDGAGARRALAVGRTGRRLAGRDAARARRGRDRRGGGGDLPPHAVDFSGGPPLHYLVADASGDSAVVEYVDGRVEVIPRGERPFQAMTNFVLTDGAPDDRYRTAMAALRRSGGRLTPASTLALLARTAQPHTRWSVAYDLRARTAYVVMGQKYGGRVLRFRV